MGRVFSILRVHKSCKALMVLMFPWMTPWQNFPQPALKVHSGAGQICALRWGCRGWQRPIPLNLSHKAVLNGTALAHVMGESRSESMVPSHLLRACCWHFHSACLYWAAMEVCEGGTETSFCWGRTMAGPPSNCSCVGALNTTGHSWQCYWGLALGKQHCDSAVTHLPAKGALKRRLCCSPGVANIS